MSQSVLMVCLPNKPCQSTVSQVQAAVIEIDPNTQPAIGGAAPRVMGSEVVAALGWWRQVAATVTMPLKSRFIGWAARMFITRLL